MSTGLARVTVDVSDAINSLVSDHKTELSGDLHISAPPSVADTIIAPLVHAFLQCHPHVRAHALITGRYVDLIADSVDVGFIVGPLRDATVGSRQLLRYRHLLVASPNDVRAHGEPAHPDELVDHRIIKFILGRPVTVDVNERAHRRDSHG